MLAIGNGEKCPWCDSVMVDFKIDGEDSLEHFLQKHHDKFHESLQGKDVGL